MTTIVVIDGASTVEREMTELEQAAYDAALNDLIAYEAAKKTQAAARASALIKLADLGLTEAEVAAIVGG